MNRCTTWWLSKKNRDLAWIEPEATPDGVRLRVVSHHRHGSAPASPKLGRGSTFACSRCGGLLSEAYLVGQGAAGNPGLRMTAVVTDKGGERIYREPEDKDLAAATVERPEIQDLDLPNIPRWFSGPRFGFTSQGDGYTPRQLALLSVLTDEIAGIPQQVRSDGGSEHWGCSHNNVARAVRGERRDRVVVADKVAPARNGPGEKRPRPRPKAPSPVLTCR